MSTDIAWTHNTINPGLYGCTWKDPSCDHCYAAKLAHRLARMGQERYAGTTGSKRKLGIHWNGDVGVDIDQVALAFAAKCPQRFSERNHLFFVTSMSDLFHKDVPDEFIGRVFEEMIARPHCIFQVLTKRIERVESTLYRLGIYSATGLRADPAPNIWLGTSVGRQADIGRLRHLRRTGAWVKFASLEPIIEDLSLAAVLRSPQERFLGIDQVIIGGESGSGARDFSVTWAQSLVKEVTTLHSNPFVKQLGARPVLADGSRLKLKDGKGQDMAEWPESLADLKQRRWPWQYESWLNTQRAAA